MAWNDLSRDQKDKVFREELSSCLAEAEQIVSGEIADDLPVRLGILAADAKEIGALRHAAPGIVLTLSVYKICNPAQDITAHKEEHLQGFSARAYDTRVTVPLLTENMLPRNVESHWLSQTFSFASEFRSGLILKTTPKPAGSLVVKLVSELQNSGNVALCRAVAVQILVEKILIRNRGRVVLTRPKGLSIETVIGLLKDHIVRKYERHGPRLPQLAFFAVYKCLLQHVGRYQACGLSPLERMKSADRKADTVGDVVVTNDSGPFEAVEIKYGQAVMYVHLAEAMDKVRALTLRRYYILATDGVSDEDEKQINERRSAFLKQNGCEIIVNGVFESLSYYLRLLPDTTEFIANYASLVEEDPDTDYEHRMTWNKCCERL